MTPSSTASGWIPARSRWTGRRGTPRGSRAAFRDRPTPRVCIRAGSWKDGPHVAPQNPAPARGERPPPPDRPRPHPSAMAGLGRGRDPGLFRRLGRDHREPARRRTRVRDGDRERSGVAGREPRTRTRSPRLRGPPVQPRHPPDPLRQLLRLPRLRCQDPQSRACDSTSPTAPSLPPKAAKIAIRPGDPAASELLTSRILIHSDADDLMPPADSHKQLTGANRRNSSDVGSNKARPTRSIGRSSRSPSHPRAAASSLRPRARSPSTGGPVSSPARLEKGGPGTRVPRGGSRDTLIRRLIAFDLSGLPPTPRGGRRLSRRHRPGRLRTGRGPAAELPRSTARTMARHWLDVARYADTHGLHLDNERQMWAWRDWVVKLLQSQPALTTRVHGRATRRRPAPEPTQDQLIATGFNRNNVTTSEGGSIDAEFDLPLRRRPRLHDRADVDGPHRRLRGLPRPQIRSDLQKGVLFPLRLLPQRRRPGHGWQRATHPAGVEAEVGRADERRLEEYRPADRNGGGPLPALLAGVTYADPATQSPPPPARELDQVWADDDAPTGLEDHRQSGCADPLRDRGTNGPVASRRPRPPKRQDHGPGTGRVRGRTPAARDPVPGAALRPGLSRPGEPAQDRHAPVPDRRLETPGRLGRLRRHRLGCPANTTERVHQAARCRKPANGSGSRSPAADLGLKPGDKIQGFALTQFGGTVYWDQDRASPAAIDPATDPRHSFARLDPAVRRQGPGEGGEGSAPDEVREDPRRTTAESAHAGTGPRSSASTSSSRSAPDTRPVFEPVLGRYRCGTDPARDDAYEGTDSLHLRLEATSRSGARAIVMERGAYDQPGRTRVPQRAGRPAPSASPDHARRHVPTRLDLARWLVAEEQSADRARGGEPVLAAVLRHRPGQDLGRLRLPRANRPAIRSCSTGWR
jgi:hypothetical protein